MIHPAPQDVAGTTDDPCEMSIDALRSAYAERSLSPVDVTKAHLERISGAGDQLNAFVTVTPEQALTDARRAETMWRHSPDSAPALLGIPYAIKDLVPTKGIRTTRGSLASSEWIPTEDSLLAHRLRNSGGSLLGKTTTSEVGWKADSGNPVNGPARNPYDLTKTAGGSSGGAAAAVAGRIATVTQGGDGAGSVRIPAAFCGVVGIKPGTGVIPYYPPSPLAPIVANGTFGRTVRDAATLLDVLAGPDYRDATSAHHRNASYRRACDEAPVSLRIAYAPEWGGRRAEPEIEQHMITAIDALRSAGHHVTVLEQTPHDRFDLLHTIWTTGFASLYPDIPNGIDPELRQVIEEAAAFSGADLASAHLQRRLYQAEVAGCFEDYDVLLTPTTPVPAFEAGKVGPETVNGKPANYLDWAWLTYAFNLSEHPAVSIPHGFTDAGLPVGVQVVGHHGRDHALVHAASQVESALISTQGS
ncbi:amidase [Corynebacterium glyciniphilum]|uniref:amidase n=1 Tax=Corynebacterium glyciniphilum TaxID=1404244 RepID=UPI003FD001AB